MICNRFVANTTGSSALPPASVSFVMLASSAEANTSAGAPSLICVTRSDDAGEVERHRGIGVLGHERVADLGERRGQRRRGEHRDVARHRRRSRRASISESSPHDAPMSTEYSERCNEKSRAFCACSYNSQVITNF